MTHNLHITTICLIQHKSLLSMTETPYVKGKPNDITKSKTDIISTTET